jgi:uncharacterized FAD-dependent dehydrogenase
MQKKITLRVKPEEAQDQTAIRKMIAAATGAPAHSVTGYNIVRESIDARSRQIWINLTLQAYVGEPFTQRPAASFTFQDVRHAKKQVVIIGAGPAGLFAALHCLELGMRPVILERGKDVRARRRDLARLNKEGILNEESNYCFGEGGAGTYSDGKLYTRSSKRGDIDRILSLFVHFGADERIRYEAHPHIGTNKLPQIISAMRERITEAGGIFHFGKKVEDLDMLGDKIHSVSTADGDSFRADAFILATGHSARDIFTLLHQKGILIESKPLAMGVRVEHPQTIIDGIQYHCRTGTARPDALPPASYQLVEQVSARGVFSFCMCPGGIIATASTSQKELVVNGWSPSKRNNPFANSGMVVQVSQTDALRYFRTENKRTPFRDIHEKDPLLLLAFQRTIENLAYEAGGGNFIAPAQRMTDLVRGKVSTSLPDCSYLRGICPAELGTVLPAFIYQTLQQGFTAFGAKMRGYLTEEAVVVATESRSSSPVRIPRDPEKLCHPQLQNLYPCGEGAGYAGGIVSAAMDGEKVAATIHKRSVI